MPSTISPKIIAQKYKDDYVDASQRTDVRLIENLHRIIDDFHRQDTDQQAMLDKITKFVYLQLEIHSLSIGMKNPLDGKFHYVSFAGLRKQSEDALRTCVYTKEDLLDPLRYPGTMISKYSKLFLAEDNPYAPGEEETYNRPMMLAQERRSYDDSIEGDYIDTWIFNKEKDVIGWIEISGTKKGKLPDVTTLKWLELVASIVGVLVGPSYERRRENNAA